MNTAKATACPNCGAPTNNLKKICEWCGGSITHISTSSGNAISDNQTILECEFRRVVIDRNAFAYIICHIDVIGHQVMQLCDFGNPQGIELWLLGIQGPVLANFNSYEEKHSFTKVQDDDCFIRSFGVDFHSAALVAESVLRQVYEVSNEKVNCSFEYGNTSSDSENSRNTTAAFIGGAILGALLD